MERYAGSCSSRSTSELPLLVSAAVGGGEIFPLIFEWIVRRLALEPELQEELRTESAEAGESLYGPKTAAAVSEAMRQLPYAAAIGPPRKLIDDLQLQGGISRMLPVGAYIPNASMLFVMHPGLVLGESWRESGTPPPIRTGKKRHTFFFSVSP